MSNENNGNGNPHKKGDVQEAAKPLGQKKKSDNTPQPCIILFIRPNKDSKWILCARTFKVVESAESYAKVNYGDAEFYTVDIDLP